MRESESFSYSSPEEAGPEEKREKPEEIAKEADRKFMAEEFGLPENATWEEIKEREMQTDFGRYFEGVMFNYPGGPYEGWPEEKLLAELNRRKEEDRKFRTSELDLPEDASWIEIWREEKEKRRKEEAASMNLPEDASWDDIKKTRNDIYEEEERHSLAVSLGLPLDASREDVEKAKQDYEKNWEEERKIKRQRYLRERGFPEDIKKLADLEKYQLRRMAKARGLPETATEEEIKNWEKEQVATYQAEMLDLPADASWEDVERAKKDLEDRRIAKELGLSDNFTPKELFKARRKSRNEENRRRLAKKLGLTKDASWYSIEAIEREKRAQELGLNLKASAEGILREECRKRKSEKLGFRHRILSWEEIETLTDLTEEGEKRLAKRAKEIGLPEEATREEINSAELARHIKKRIADLDLPENVSSKGLFDEEIRTFLDPADYYKRGDERHLFD